MPIDLCRVAAVLVGALMFAGCSSAPQYKVMLQADVANKAYTLWVTDENGRSSSLRYSAWSSHFLKRFDRNDLFLLDRLGDGEAPVFFDLFGNGKRYLLLQDSEGGNRGPFHLRVFEFDADGWRQIHYAACEENPVLNDVDGDGRMEFSHSDFFTSPLPPVSGGLCGTLILEYADGRIEPTSHLNQRAPMSRKELETLAAKCREFIQKMKSMSTCIPEDIKTHFVKGALIDLLYCGNWKQCDQVIQILKFDPASGERLKREILEEVQNSPYYLFVSNLNIGNVLR